MRFKGLVLSILVVLLPLAGFAQHHHKTRGKAIQSEKQLPDWAVAKHYNNDAHVYFPDYHAFYDPNRGGYVFMEGNKWTFTPTVPPYMKDADLTKARVQILKGLSLQMHPELDYPRYMKLYPEKQVDGNDILTPTPFPAPNNK